MRREYPLAPVTNERGERLLSVLAQSEFQLVEDNEAVVAREYGKPCVVGIDQVVALVRDGQLVEVDGTAGTVRILPQPRRHEPGVNEALSLGAEDA